MHRVDRHSYWHNRAARRRAGVSLLEVLFSIGITAVGLLGVLTILPVAGSRMAKGTIADEADRAGRNAVHQFDIRHMRLQRMWTGYAQTGPTTFAYQAYVPGNGESFCIDPWFVAWHESNGTWTPEAGYFPYTTAVPSPPRMRRISLQPFPDAAAGMDLAHADQIFVAHDDLAFDVPDDRTLPPLQRFGAGSAKREIQGRFSWMATLTPKDTASNLVTDTYVLSVVVFHRRIRDLGEERILSVKAFLNSGYAGGDVTLGSDNLDDLEELVAGEWIMLGAVPGATYPVFGWYRVQSVEGQPRMLAGPPVTYELDVSLFGRDWPYTPLPTTATWVPGTVAVYEKTIRLETTSMWTLR